MKEETTRPDPPPADGPSSAARRASPRAKASPPPLEDAAQAIVDEEDAMCRRVVKHLREERTPSRPPPRHNDDSTLLELRDQIASARLEDVASLMAQMQQVAAVASNRGKQAKEPTDASNPYFGHLRLEEEGRGIRDVLIGRSTYIEPRAGIRIVDWRHAPVSQLYYRYEEGASYEETFGDREVEGEVLVRRTVTVIDGELQRISAPQGQFVRGKRGWRQLDDRETTLAGGEGSAVRADHMRGMLGVGEGDQREDRHLPEIAALLDPKQFDFISRPDAGVVVIQGGAGSGKTTIGVHRMAYLAYQSEVRFATERMLVVVGTPALRDYIGQLLQALGMGAVRVVTFDRWARRQREQAFDWLARIPQEDNTPVEVSRLKTDPLMHDLLVKNAARWRKEGRTRRRDVVSLWADTLTAAGRIRAAFAPSLAAGTSRLNEAQLDRALAWCAERCPAVEEWKLDHDDPAGDDGDGFGVDDEMAGADGHREPEDLRASLDPEDEALLLRAYQLLHGPLMQKGKGGGKGQKRRALRYEHLFVDEAQDLAPIEIAILADITSTQKSITLAGDTSQRLHVDTGFESWSDVLGALDLKHVEIEPLRIAYRSTREVLRFARDVLGPLADPVEPIAPRSGAPVEEHHFPTQGAAAAFLAEALRPLFSREPRATVAILTRYPEQADAYYEVLRRAEVPFLRRVKNFDFAFRPGIEVTEIRQVKGLEYDYVILCDVTAQSYPARDEARYQLHIGATRAAHQLWVVSHGQRSPLIPDWLIGDD
ncbi:MAG: UvrD-helicase domain-containing protein [Myxococcota bacterium]